MKIDEFLDMVDKEELKVDGQGEKKEKIPVVSQQSAIPMPSSALTSDHTVQALEKSYFPEKAVAQKQDSQPVMQQSKKSFFSFGKDEKKTEPVVQQVTVVQQRTLTAKEELDQLIVTFEETIKSDKISDAMIAYARLKQASHKIIELDEGERSQVYNRIITADNELTEKLEAIEQKSAAYINQITESVRKSSGLDFKTALQEYAKVKRIADAIPDIAANQKQEAQSIVLRFYVDVLVLKQKEDQKTITLAHTQIMDDIVKARELIQQSKFAEANALYKESMNQYNVLPAGFLKEKSALYKTIVALFNEISFSEKMSALKTMMQQQQPRSAQPGVMSASLTQPKPLQTPQPIQTQPSQQTGTKKINVQNAQTKQTVAAADPIMHDAIVLRAKYALKEGNVAQAQKDLSKVLDANPDHSGALRLKEQINQAAQTQSVAASVPSQSSFQTGVPLPPPPPAPGPQTNQLLVNKLRRIEFDIGGGKKKQALDELVALAKQYPNNAQILALKKKAEALV